MSPRHLLSCALKVPAARNLLLLSFSVIAERQHEVKIFVCDDLALHVDIFNDIWH